MSPGLAIVLFVVLAPLAGGLLAGLDRIVTARMQGRYGPPALQPFFDVFKLCEKQNIVVNRAAGYFLFCFVVFLLFSGSIFFAGDDLLMAVFAMAVADMFLVMSACSVYTPYAHIGAQRELLQVVAAEPMLLLTAVGLYAVTGSFDVGAMLAPGQLPAVLYLPGVFVGLVYVLTIKLRKSPFDLSTSHHAHQELVKGLTTELSGRTLAMFEVAHWYETILLLGFVFLLWGQWPLLGLVVVAAVYFLEVLIDNTHARFRWQWTTQSAWLAALVLGGGNLLLLYWLRPHP